MATLGIRRNNPGNIEYNTKNKWQGEEPWDGQRFTKFKTPIDGIRALAVLLIAYQDRWACHTIKQIIDRWAPPSENDNSGKPQNLAYIAHVAELTGFAPNAQLDLHQYQYLEPIVKGIITHENGAQPYDQDTIDTALNRAGVTKGKENDKPLIVKSGSAQAGAGTIAAGGAAIAVEVAREASPYASTLQTIAQYAPWIIGAIVILGGGYIIWRAVRRRQQGVE